MQSSISSQRLNELHESGKQIDLIDVRTPAEFREVHIPFAKNVPLDRLDAKQISASRHGRQDQPFYTTCQSGLRGQKACEKLAAAGIDAVNIEGGTLAWAAAGLPVVRGKKAIALERQVRIAAGSLVLVGCIIGYFVHPLGYGLAVFVGAGLVFAGVTDTCGMGMLLARMPWNQCGAASESCCNQ